MVFCGLSGFLLPVKNVIVIVSELAMCDWLVGCKCWSIMPCDGQVSLVQDAFLPPLFPGCASEHLNLSE